jgi:hypothetical protein
MFWRSAACPKPALSLSKGVVAQPGTNAAVGIEDDVNAAQVVGQQEAHTAAIVHGHQLAAEEVMFLDRSGGKQLILVQLAEVNGSSAVVAAQACAEKTIIPSTSWVKCKS